jgi:ribosomal-protein-alanine N-acetyltransferase
MIEKNDPIITPRLVLKPVDPSLIHVVFNTKSKDEIKNIFGVDENGYLHFKSMHEEGMETHRISLFFFLLVDKLNGVTFGHSGYHTWNKTHRRAELFYVLLKEEYMQKGYMTEALKYVIEYGFSELGLHRIQAMVAEENIPSVKLIHKYGFTKEGTMREDYCVNGKNEDSDCYSLLKWEWDNFRRTISE